MRAAQSLATVPAKGATFALSAATPEIMWAAILAVSENGAPFSIADAVQAATAIPMGNVSCIVTAGAMDSYVHLLIQARVASYAGIGVDRTKLYTIIKPRHLPHFLDGAGNVCPRYQVMDLMWRAMKMLKSFNVRELALQSTLPGVLTVSEAIAETYVSHLIEAGYLRRVNKYGTSPVYGLAPGMATGPVPPRIMTGRLVYDPNRRSVVNDVIHVDEVPL
ncbi:hypothetical protein [Taklimakanibacter albus]|uniref:Uncharacterized protein n=1 Tax=Taklimakanibacter albus TaxID=2800327 RepID=A0ACC5R6J9_9HYPH|nr:hypothetical protein [Aestuariivirga sp. YIM B02566]MBK1868286.1 hypothetical protein [Aestuariivirga sp. YIM B02566]